METDFVVEVGDIKFSVEKELSDFLDYFDVDYYAGWLRKGFVVYANGLKGGC